MFFLLCILNVFLFATLAQKQDWDDNNHIPSRHETLYVTEFEFSNEHLPEASNFDDSHPHPFFRNFQRSPKWAFRLDGKHIFIRWWCKKKRVCEGTACMWIFNIVLLSKVTNGTAGIAAPKNKVIDGTALRTKSKSEGPPFPRWAAFFVKLCVSACASRSHRSADSLSKLMYKKRPTKRNFDRKLAAWHKKKVSVWQVRSHRSADVLPKFMEDK